MNELEEVEGTNKNLKISKQQGLQSSNSKQQVKQQASDLELTWQHATGKGSSIEKT